MNKKKIVNLKQFNIRLFLVLCDILAVVTSSFLALWVRYEFAISKMAEEFVELIYKNIPISFLIVFAVFLLMGMYRSVWAYASYHEVIRGIMSCFIADVAFYVLVKIRGQYLPRSFWFLYFIFLALSSIGIRFSFRALRVVSNKLRRKKGYKEAVRVMVVGAGEAGNMLIRELKYSDRLNCDVICAVDDDRAVVGNKIHGVKIVGGCEAIEECAEKYNIDRIVIAMPSVGKKRISEITSLCSKTGCEVKILPGIYDIVSGKVNVTELRDVDIEDLLGREPVELNTEKILNSLKEKTVIVTGGGGSIGSELCRQIAAAGPKMLIIFDIYENNAYEIQMELQRHCPELNLVVLIGSVRNTERVEDIFRTYHPDVVFHAAAHKHVPLMEVSPNEAIKNNVFGTLCVSQMADKYKAERFVLISTDKAVNPTNVMGASKRLCEMIIQAYSRRSETDFVAVRFGNVLGSNGSVIPLFKQQIAEGGPVTVTHPDIIRYFMTIPEAVALVLEAGALAKGGEIFVLDMGEPVRIADLAENLIRLSGLIPNEDIDIKYTGLRPGEKLYEERLMDEEGLSETENKKISIAKPIEMNDDEFFEKLNGLYEAVYGECDDVRSRIKELVKTYNLKRNNWSVTCLKET